MSLYQFVDFTLQVVNALQFPLAAAPSSQSVLAASPHAVDKVELLLGQVRLLQKLLEVVPAQVHDPLHREWQVNLQTNRKELI